MDTSINMLNSFLFIPIFVLGAMKFISFVYIGGFAQWYNIVISTFFLAAAVVSFLFILEGSKVAVSGFCIPAFHLSLELCAIFPNIFEVGSFHSPTSILYITDIIRSSSYILFCQRGAPGYSAYYIALSLFLLKHSSSSLSSS